MCHPIPCHHSTAPAKCICFLPFERMSPRVATLHTPIPAGHVVHCTCPCAHILLQLNVAFPNFAFKRRFLASTTRLAQPSYSHFHPSAFSYFRIVFNFAFARAMDIYATVMHSHFYSLLGLGIYSSSIYVPRRDLP